MMTRYEQIEAECLDEFRDRLGDVVEGYDSADPQSPESIEAFQLADPGDISDLIAEIADANVPVYHGELLELAAGDLATDGVGVVAPEMGPAFDGTPTATNIIAANVYERLSEALENLDIVDATLAGSSWEVS